MKMFGVPPSGGFAYQGPPPEGGTQILPEEGIMPIAAKLLSGLFGLCILSIALPAHAQDPKLQMNSIDHLAARAVESIEVSLNDLQLQFVRKMARLDRNDQTRNLEQLAKFDSVSVRMFEFAQEGEYAEADVEPIRAQLRAPGWERFLPGTGDEGRKNGTFIMQRNGEIVGYAAIYSDPRRLCVINVTGRMNQEDVKEFNSTDCHQWNSGDHRRSSR